MAPLPPNSTTRYFLDYSVAGYDHTMEVRTESDAVDSGVVEAVSAFIEVVGAFCYPTSVVGFRKQVSGTDVSFDVPWGGPSTWGSGTAIPAVTAQYYNFIGRDIEGRRVRIGLFGAGLLTSGGNYRITDVEASWVGDALSELTSDPAFFLTIGGLSAVWKQYVNCGVNAYWRNKVR